MPDAATAFACLKTIDPQALIAAGTRAAKGELLAFAPFTGNATQANATMAALQTGQFLHLPVLNGFTRDEMRLYVGYDVQGGAKITAESYPAAVRAIYGDKVDKVLARYPLKPSEHPAETLGSLMSDFMPGLGITHCLMLESGRLLGAYTPVFSGNTPTAPRRHAASRFPSAPNPASISAPSILPSSTRCSPISPTPRPCLRLI